jgi:hypothetical protein
MAWPHDVRMHYRYWREMPLNRILRLQAVLLVMIVGLGCCACSSKHDQPAQSQAWEPSNIWKSETTGKEYRVRIEGDRFYAEWVNLPPAAAQRGAYIHTVCRRAGSKWVGTSNIFMPCTVGEGKSEHIADTCRLSLKIEIDSVTQDRITGRGQSLEKFDCQSCKVIATGWGNFVWIPAR